MAYRSVSRLFFLSSLCMAATLASAASNPLQVQTSFVGISSVHAKYEALLTSPPYYSTATSATLVAKRVDTGAETTVLSTTGTIPLTLSGGFQLRDLPQDVAIQYQLKINGPQGEQSYPVEAGLVYADAINHPSGNKISGRLLFDDTISAPAGGGKVMVSAAGVVVPAGITLTLANDDFAEASYWGTQSITVEGSLVVPSSLRHAILMLGSPVTFGTLADSYIRFGSGSGGSAVATASVCKFLGSGTDGGEISIGNSSLCSLDTAAYSNTHWRITGGEKLELTDSGIGSVTITDMQHLHVKVAGGSTITVRGGSLAGLNCNLAAGNRISLSDMPLDSPLLSPSTWEFVVAGGAGGGRLQMEGLRWVDYGEDPPNQGFGVFAIKPDQAVFKKCEFPAVPLSTSGWARYEDCYFRGNVDTGAGLVTAGTPSFARCEFQSTYFSTAKVVDSVFHEALTFAPETGSTLIARGNSFLADQGIIRGGTWTDFTIGENYFGDPAGPNYGALGFLNGRGAAVGRNMVVSHFATHGPLAHDPMAFPRFWCWGYVLGQGSIPHRSGERIALVKGLPTLLSLDVAANTDVVTGARFTVIWEGEEIEPMGGQAIIYRSGGESLDKARINATRGANTINFLLPATDSESVDFVVMLDTRGVTGYDAGITARRGKELPFITATATFPKDPPGRPLRIMAMPVELNATGYPTGKGSIAPLVPGLQQSMPALLPMRATDLVVEPGPTFTYTPPTFSWNLLTAASTTALLNSVSGELKAIAVLASTCNWWNDNSKYSYDIVVGSLVPEAFPAGVSGANLRLRREAPLVADGKPDAALHEIGHWAGLYTGTEQYTAYPELGLQMEATTTFYLDPIRRPPWISGKISPYGLIHFPRATSPLFDSRVYDLMGAQANPLLLPSTYDGFQTAFENNLKAPTPRKATGGTPPAGVRRIWLSALTQTVDEYDRGLPVRHFALVPESIRLFDATSSLKGTVVQPFINYDTKTYTVKSWDAAGTLLNTQDLYSYFTAETRPCDADLYWATLDIPEATARLEISTRPTDILRTFTASEGLTVSVVEPAPGATLTGSTATVRLQASRKAAIAKSELEPIGTLMLASADAGVSWKLVGIGRGTDPMALNLDAFPAGNSVRLRVLASDGLRRAEAEVANLHIPPRPPQPMIVFPRDGAEAAAGTTWSFRSVVYDPDNDVANSGVVWTSNRDGALGTGQTLEAVALTPGDHTISCTATDSSGSRNATSIQIHVTTDNTVDLALGETSLHVQVRGGDPALLPNGCSVIKPDQPHLAQIRLSNSGQLTTATMVLRLVKPSGAEQVLVNQRVATEPFAETILSGAFTPTEEGYYRLIGSIEAVEPADRNLANNTWTRLLPTTKKNDVIATLVELPASATALDLNWDQVIDAADLVAP